MATYQTVVNTKRQLYDLLSYSDSIQSTENIYIKANEYGKKYNELSRLQKTDNRKYWLLDDSKYRTEKLIFSDPYISTEWLINNYGQHNLSHVQPVWNRLYLLNNNQLLEESISDVIELAPSRHYMSAAIYTDNPSQPLLYNFKISFQVRTEDGEIHSINSSTQMCSFYGDQTATVYYGNPPTLSDIRKINVIPEGSNVYFNLSVFSSEQILHKYELPRILVQELENSPIVSSQYLYISKSNTEEYQKIVI